MIASSSPAELDSPFIFQLPATSGRRAEDEVIILILASAQRLADRAWRRQSAAGDPAYVAVPCGAA
jgi:hypothetical protein